MSYRILSIGEILFDHFPTHKRLGGAPFNVAYHLHQLGMDVVFISRVGDDEDGRNILIRLEKEGFPTAGIQVDDKYPTGKVLVELDKEGVPRFEIVEPAAYDFIEMTKELEELLEDGIDLVYIGTLAQRNRISRNTIQRIFDILPPRIPVMYDVNLRNPFYNKEIVEFSLVAADIVKLNEDEFEILRNWFAQGESYYAAARLLMRQFKVTNLCITHGESGSELHYPLGREVVNFGEMGAVRVTDTVGAGDGFAAVLALGFLKDWTPRQIIRLASEFAAQICQIDGAVPDDSGFYNPFRSELNNI